MEELQFPGKSPSRVPNNFRFDSGSVEATGGQKSDKIELTGIGIFGGEADSEAEEKLDSATDEEYVDEISRMKDFGARKPGFKRPTTVQSPPVAGIEDDLNDGSAFTFRRGRFPPRKTTKRTSTTSPSTTTSTTTTTADVLDDGLDIGLDLGSDEDERPPFREGQRLIPNHIFRSPSLPIQNQVGPVPTVYNY